MDFAAAIRFPFRSPRWLPNLALLMVCMIIPFIGPIVALGYGVMMQRMLLRDWNMEPPAFDFGAFTDHLKRGVIPFVVSLIFIPVLFAAMAAGWVIVLLAVLLARDYPMTALLVGICGISLDVVLMLATGVFVVPMILKAGLEGNIGAAFDWSFLRDFYRRVGWLTLGVQLAIFAMTIPFMLIACIPFVGPAVGQTLLMELQWHLHAQLYREYVRRGGREMVIPEEPTFPAPVYGFPTTPIPPPPPPQN